MRTRWQRYEESEAHTSRSTDSGRVWGMLQKTEGHEAEHLKRLHCTQGSITEWVIQKNQVFLKRVRKEETVMIQ